MSSDEEVTEPKPGSGHWISKMATLAWLAIPVIIAVVVGLALSPPSSVWNPPGLIPALNVIFLSTVPFFVSLLAAISFLRGRAIVALLLGGSMLALGLGALMVLITSVSSTPNSMITLYNTAALFASALGLVLVQLLYTSNKKWPGNALGLLAVAYLAILGLVIGLLLLVTSGNWPVYFIPGTGQTKVGELVLFSAITLFFISSALLMIQHQKGRYDFSYWYALGLALIAAGLLGASLQTQVGDALNWIGRTSQYLGAIFMLIAVVTSAKISGSWLLPLEKALRESEGRYQTLVNMSPEAIIVLVGDKIVFTNRAAREIVKAPETGLSANVNITSFLYSEQHEEASKQIAALRKGEVIAPWESKIQAMDGSRIDVEVCGSMIEFDSQPALMIIARDITQRRRAEEDLRVSEERFRLALLNAPVTVAVQDKDLRFIWAYNQKTAEPKEIIGKGEHDLFYPEEAAVLIEAKGRAMAEDRELRWQMWLQRKPQRMFLDITISPYHDKDGKVVGVATTTVDLTPMKLAEMDLEESRAKYVSLFENLDESICLFGVERDWNNQITNCVLIEANRSALRDFGSAPMEEWRGKDLASLPGGGLAPTLESVRSAFAAGNPTSEEMRAGNGRYYQSTIIPVDSGHVISARADITERKKAEEAFREHEKVLRMVLDNSQDGINMLDLTTGQYLFISPSQVGLTGFTIEEIAGITAEEAYQRVHPEDRHRSIEQQKAVIAGIDMAGPVEYRWMVKSGEYRWFSDRRKLVRDDEGRPIALVGISRDITEEKRAQSVMNEYAVRLEHSNAELQQFAYVSSHDLQEPLRMVIANLSQLERKYRDKMDPAAKAYIDRAIDGGGRMRELIDDLLEYSRVDSVSVEMGPVDMDFVTRSVLDLLAGPIKESGADIDLRPLPVLQANISQMRQVMQNLVSNAVKFRGKERPRIRIWAEPGPTEWTVAVEDNGIGFDMAYSEKVFEMFQRLHTRDKYPGNGVGLAVVKKIEERHGGRIWAVSSEGKGTTFFFTMPRGPET